MKKVKLFGLGFLFLAVSMSLVACGETSVDAGVPSGYEEVTKDKITDYTSVRTIKNIQTNCFYSFAVRVGNGGGVSIVQMFVEENGVSVPYCE